MFMAPPSFTGEIDVTAIRLDWLAIQSSGRMGQLTTHHQRGVGLPDDLKAMAPDRTEKLGYS